MKGPVFIVVVLIVVFGYLLLKKDKVTPENNVIDQVVTQEESVENSNTSTDNVVVGELREFTVEGGNFNFSMAEIKVNQGDTVRITFVNKEGFHDLKLDEFNVATKQIKTGESETIEFVADKAGTFEYYCSVGSHRAQGMVGKLIVE